MYFCKVNWFTNVVEQSIFCHQQLSIEVVSYDPIFILSETHIYSHHRIDQPVPDRYYCYTGILDKEHGTTAGGADQT